MSNGVYKFHWDCRRIGVVDAIFVSDEKTVKAAIGMKVYLGEVLGKHSDIHGVIGEGDIKKLTDNQDVIDFVINELEGGIGRNPFVYCRCDECGEEVWPGEDCDWCNKSDEEKAEYE